MKRTQAWFALLIFFVVLLPACKLVQLAPIPVIGTATHAASAPVSTVPPPVEQAGGPEIISTSAPGLPPENPGAPEIANYEIAVRLDADNHLLTGEQSIIYTNIAQKSFSDLVFHLYLNAFKNDQTTFMQESGGQLRGFEFNPQSAGWIEVTDVSLASGEPLELKLLEDGTLARTHLPEPVEPGQSVTVRLKFRAQLPEIFARTGWVLDERGDPFFLVGQWFPKLGVWTDDGWIADVFHGNAEFFADFGRYDVSLTLPAEYTHGATGALVEVQQNSDRTQTAFYQAAGVIDFVWVASPHIREVTRQVGDVELVYLYLPEHEWSVEKVLDTAQGSLETFSEWFGPYPYARLTVSDVPEEGSGAGGMEYPTFITAGVSGRDQQTITEEGWTNFAEVVVVHEVAHQWWQSMVATNEAREPWLDEGFADYSTVRYFIEKYGLNFLGQDKEALRPGFLAGRRASFLRAPDLRIYGTAWDMPYNQYVIAAYSKPDMALMTLEGQLGEETMLAILQTYFERFRFKHPTTQDFQRVAVEISGQSLDWFFDGIVYGEETLNWQVESASGDTVTIVRHGEIALPADMLVTFENGRTVTETCGANEPICKRSFAGQTVKSVVLDPERKLMIETDWSDNKLP